MNRPWGSHPSWSRRSSRRSGASAARVRRFCWWSRTRGWRSGWPIGATSSRLDASSSTTPPMPCSRATSCASRTWAKSRRSPRAGESATPRFHDEAQGSRRHRDRFQHGNRGGHRPHLRRERRPGGHQLPQPGSGPAGRRESRPGRLRCPPAGRRRRRRRSGAPDGATDGRALGTARHPGQQCRYINDRPLGRAQRGRLAPDPRRRSDRSAPLRPGGGPGNDFAGRRRHPQHLLDPRGDRAADARRLLRGEARAHRPDQGARGRVGAAPHPRGGDQPRVHRDTDGCGRPNLGRLHARRHPPANSAGALRDAGRGRPVRALPRVGGREIHHRQCGERRRRLARLRRMVRERAEGMEAPIFTYMTKYRYRKVVLCQNADVGLKAVIAIHSTTLGPATGGTRMWTYQSEADAIVDAMRLARGMTYKYAAAGVDLGGGKCVIIGDPKTEKTEGLLRALGRFIQSLGGEFQTGEDVGTTLDDMEVMAAECDYIVTLPEHAGGAGPIAPATAFGVLQAMKVCCREVYGSESLKGRRVSLQGLGAVGAEMLKLLAEEGAPITVAGIDEVKVGWARRDVGARAVGPDALYAEPCDIFCPCALGGILNDEVIPALRCRIICGSANNQLWEERHGDELHRRGNLYAPRHIAHARGAIFDTHPPPQGAFNPQRGHRHRARIGETMERLIARSQREAIPTSVAADRLAEERLAMKERVRLI